MSPKPSTMEKQGLALFSAHFRRTRMNKKSQKIKVIYGDYFARVKKIMKHFEKMFLHNISSWKKRNAQFTTSTKKGHFSVLALGVNAEPRKFSLALDYLSHPTFIKLLEKAEREFGYYQQGVIAIPCEAGVGIAESLVGVNKPELLLRDFTPVIDVAGFLSDGQV
ncbi:hypothetical protein RND71_035913 [Anisodus tanguticus]|uniref:Uncharacterized protein n=1 Tax=Anisodus tanguticus TaxID=243964 RepID=A0AAE1R8I4_9SOLA|nr:hypothetical protein RND71_035913 [Anisodus tanguticus]